MSAFDEGEECAACDCWVADCEGCACCCMLRLSAGCQRLLPMIVCFVNVELICAWAALGCVFNVF